MSQEKSPAFQFYPKDFLSDENVLFMSMEQRGIYITLICVCWMEGSISGDMQRLRLKFGTGSDVLQPVLDCFSLSTTPDRLIHKRLEEERIKQKAYSKVQSENGKLGGRPRAKKPKKATAKPSLSQTKAKRKPNKALQSSSPIESTTSQSQNTCPSGDGRVRDITQELGQPKAGKSTRQADADNSEPHVAQVAEQRRDAIYRTVHDTRPSAGAAPVFQFDERSLDSHELGQHLAEVGRPSADGTPSAGAAPQHGAGGVDDDTPRHSVEPTRTLQVNNSTLECERPAERNAPSSGFNSRPAPTPTDNGDAEGGMVGKVKITRAGGYDPKQGKAVRDPTLEPTDNNGFATWYASYPRKVGKRDAQKAWRTCRLSVAVLLNNWPMWLLELNRRDSDMIPYPARFIRSKCWEEPPPAHQTAPRADPQLENEVTRSPKHDREVDGKAPCGLRVGTCTCWDDDPNVVADAKSDAWNARQAASWCWGNGAGGSC